MTDKQIEKLVAKLLETPGRGQFNLWAANNELLVEVRALQVVMEQVRDALLKKDPT